LKNGLDISDEYRLELEFLYADFDFFYVAIPLSIISRLVLSPFQKVFVVSSWNINI